MMLAAVVLSMMVVWETASILLPDAVSGPVNTTWGSGSTRGAVRNTLRQGTLPHVKRYFDQAFAVPRPPRYDFADLRDACANAVPVDDDVYIRCGGMAAGLTSIVSQIKVCLKMAIDTGSNLVLPSMPLRDSTNLKEFNFLNGDAYQPYDQWFDADHLREALGRACPRMKIVHPSELDKTVAIKTQFNVDCEQAAGYEKFKSLFWSGRPYRNFFSDKYHELKAKALADPNVAQKEGITLVNVDSEFLLFRITDDPTGRDLRFWNDLDRVVRYLEQPRQVIQRLQARMTRPYYGVHFRVENDTMWSSLEHQLAQDLDALDLAWEMQGRPQPRPLVYLACGDAGQMQKFITAGAGRGWDVTHKWKLVEDDAITTNMINELAFDFMGAVDMGIMVKSEFFIGITGSAFSSTITNIRDPTGRYRGSSFEVSQDDGARNHLFFDLDAREYGCCL
ncbi:hypothetical protein GQ53DRAFT_755242 [Thozetella sp. PMI_491]|nr:hypothetical protein GQ53DRAFT_755242 [Thozetella sp. PMI_491]